MAAHAASCSVDRYPWIEKQHSAELHAFRRDRCLGGRRVGRKPFEVLAGLSNQRGGVLLVLGKDQFPEGGADRDGGSGEEHQSRRGNLQSAYLHVRSPVREESPLETPPSLADDLGPGLGNGRTIGVPARTRILSVRDDDWPGASSASILFIVAVPIGLLCRR